MTIVNSVLYKKSIELAKDIAYYAPRNAPGRKVNPPSFEKITAAFDNNQTQQIRKIVLDLKKCLEKVNRLDDAEELLRLAKHTKAIKDEKGKSLPGIAFYHAKKIVTDTIDIVTFKNHRSGDENHTNPIKIIKNDLFGIFKPIPTAKDQVKSELNDVELKKIAAGEKPLHIQIKEEKESNEQRKTPSP